VWGPALFLLGILVTTDQKLRKRAQAWVKERHLEIVAKSPKEAVEYLDTLT
jgi:hypothetical protein